MSIWGSWPHIGSDRLDAKPERGNVLSYAEGFGNHYPDLTGSHERRAVVALAHVAPWCVPGHDQDGAEFVCTGCGIDHDTEVGPWLRLETVAWQPLNFWGRGGPAVEEEQGVKLALDEDAVRALRDDLTKWLDAPKVRPTETGRA